MIYLLLQHDYLKTLARWFKRCFYRYCELIHFIAGFIGSRFRFVFWTDTSSYGACSNQFIFAVRSTYLFFSFCSQMAEYWNEHVSYRILCSQYVISDPILGNERVWRFGCYVTMTSFCDRFLFLSKYFHNSTTKILP